MTLSAPPLGLLAAVIASTASSVACPDCPTNSSTASCPCSSNATIGNPPEADPLLRQKLAKRSIALPAHNLVLFTHGGSLLLELALTQFYQNWAERAASTFRCLWHLQP